MAQFEAQLQQILIGQQELQHQQITMTSQIMKVADELEDKYWDTPAEVTSPVTNLTSTQLGGHLSLGGVIGLV